MKEQFKKLKDIYSDPCITVILNTHRTKPDNLQDPINLKNLLKEVDERLAQHYEVRRVRELMEKVNAVVDSIDHNYNLDSLAIFVNDDIAEFVRMPISVEDRVLVDQTFGTRDLVRNMHQAANYYTLVISRDEARLIEASSDKVVEEVKGEFPFKNETLYTTGSAQASTDTSDNLVREFFNRVDKALQTVLASHPLPVLVVTEERNFHFYSEIADNKAIILGHLNRNRNDEKAHHIVADAWPIVNELNLKQIEESKSELMQAVSQQNFLSDIGEIWRAVNEGRGDKLFVQKGFFQPAVVSDNGTVTLLSAENAHAQKAIDDIVDEVIERQFQFGGSVVFLDDLADFQGLALKTRY